MQKGNKDKKSAASLNAPIDRQDSHASARAYAMKAIEDKDALDVIVGNFTIFDTLVHALIDPGSTWVVYRRVKPSMISC